MEKIFCKSPTRVDLAGGTLDLWPLYNFVNGATTVNVAIDIWTTCEINLRSDKQIIINSTDLNRHWSFLNYSDFCSSSEGGLGFYQAIFRKFDNAFAHFERGFEVTTSSQSPIGGGLGGSSSLVISILKALHKLLDIRLPAIIELVHLAHNIEAEMLRTPTGTQDYVPAIGGGLNFIQYSAHGMTLNVKSISETPLNDHFLLVYTGRSHHSGLNNFEVLKSAVQGDTNVLKALSKIKDIADQLKSAIEQNEWKKLPDLFKDELKARVQLTSAFSSPEIEKLNQICLAAGAEAVKICGAGGGGCVLVWVAPNKRQNVIKVCEAENFTCLNAKPVDITIN